MNRLNLILVLCLITPVVFGQLTDDSIDFSRIRQSKVRKLLRTNEVLNKNDFANLQEVCSVKDDKSFGRHVKSYIIPRPVSEVWEAYTTVSPGQSWSGRIASFGVLFNCPETPLVYSDAAESRMVPGQIFLVQLNLLKGYFKLAVANKIMEVNEDKKEFKICYISSGASEGSQFIRIKETPEGYAEVEHESFFKSKSKFRDKRLYPKIHEMIISEYHANVAASMDCGIAGL